MQEQGVGIKPALTNAPLSRSRLSQTINQSENKPHVMLARVAQIRVAVRMKYMCPDPNPERPSHEHVGSPVVPRQKTSERYRRCRRIRQHLHPLLRILV